MFNRRKSDQPAEKNQSNKSIESPAHNFIGERSTLSDQEKKLCRLVEKEGGKVIQLSPPSDIFKGFLPTLNEIKEIVAGPTLRHEGLTIYPTSQIQSAEVISELMSIIEIDKNPSENRRTLFRSAQEQFQSWDQNTKLYHSASVLDYLFARYVGWIDPMDLDWFLREKAHVDLRRGDTDYGFSLSKSLSDSIIYGKPGHLGSLVEVLYSYLGKPIPESFRVIKNHAVALEIEVAGLMSSFPEGKVFWEGTVHHEYCCPLMPPDLPGVGLSPLAIIEWPLPIEKSKVF